MVVISQLFNILLGCSLPDCFSGSGIENTVWYWPYVYIWRGKNVSIVKSKNLILGHTYYTISCGEVVSFIPKGNVAQHACVWYDGQCQRDIEEIEEDPGDFPVPGDRVEVQVSIPLRHGKKKYKTVLQKGTFVGRCKSKMHTFWPMVIIDGHKGARPYMDFYVDKIKPRVKRSKDATPEPEHSPIDAGLVEKV